MKRNDWPCAKQKGSLLKQETLSTISRLSVPLQNDEVARKHEPQLRLKNGNLL